MVRAQFSLTITEIKTENRPENETVAVTIIDGSYNPILTCGDCYFSALP